jgi:hypothetical protein
MNAKGSYGVKLDRFPPERTYGKEVSPVDEWIKMVAQIKVEPT